MKKTYLIPRMDDSVESLGDGSIFSTLDANSGYWKIPTAREGQNKTIFTCQSGNYRFKRILFGLMNAPALLNVPWTY